MGFPHPFRTCMAVLAMTVAVTACSDKAAEAESHLQNAARYEADGDPRAAMLELKSALQLTPDNADARLRLGRIYLGQGLGPAARKELERGRSLGATDPDLALDVVRAMLLSREFEDALAAIGKNSKDTAAWKVAEGDTLLALNRPDDARAAYQRALELEAGSTQARRGLARVEMTGGDPQSARSHVDKALEADAREVQTWLLKGELELSLQDLAAAEASFNKVLELSPELPAGLIGLARALLAQNRTDEASPHLRALERRNVDNPLLSYLKAVEARQKNDLKAAQDALRDVLKVAPNHAPSQLLMGQIHLLQRELDQAKSMLASYVAQAPTDATGRKLLAAVLVELDDPREAIRILEPVEKANPDDAQALSLIGTAYMKLREFDKGREYMDRATQTAPETPAIRTQLAISQLASGDTEGAAAQLETVIEQDPQFQRADFLLVLARLREGNTDAALSAALKLVEKHPDSAQAHNLLGAVHETRKQTDLARAAYEHSAGLAGESHAAMLNLARLDMIDGKPEEARKRFEAVLERRPDEVTALMGLAKLANDAGDAEKSLDFLDRARQKNPSAVRPRLVLADYHLRRGEAAEALEIAEEAAQQSPDMPAVMLLLGRSQLAAGRAVDAERTLGRLAAAVPESPLAHFNLALARQAAGQPSGARASLERTLELAPQNHLARATLGQVLLRMEAYDEAFAIAERLEKDLPDAAAADILRGDTLQAQGKAGEAAATYLRAFEKQPNSALVLKLILAEQRAGLGDQANERAARWLEQNPGDAAVRSILAASTHLGGDESEALRQYEQVLESNPRNVVALNNLAWLYDRNGDPRALELAKRAYDILPGRAEVADTYGWLLVKSGQVEQGLVIIEKALEQAPDNADIVFHKAAALERAGEAPRAREMLETLLGEAGEFAEREQAQALLDKLKGN